MKAGGASCKRKRTDISIVSMSDYDLYGPAKKRPLSEFNTRKAKSALSARAKSIARLDVLSMGSQWHIWKMGERSVPAAGQEEPLQHGEPDVQCL